MKRELTKSEFTADGRYELSPVHMVRDRAERCWAGEECTLLHLYSVYHHADGGPMAEWLADCGTPETARALIATLAGAYDADLTQQLSASIMDCVTSGEAKLTHRCYAWGEDRSQMYVDVAQMARDTTAAWKHHNVGGVIYEISEAIADASIAAQDPIDAAAIDAICKVWEGSKDF